MTDQNDDLLRALRDPLMWRKPTAPARRGWAAVAAMLEQADAEDDAADALCDAILTGPHARWPERLAGTDGTRTLGMVRQLLARMPALAESRPAAGLQLTSMAISVSEAVRDRDYLPDQVMQVRGQALRDHASVLAFLGRYAEALQYVERAERLLEQVPAARFDRARLAVVKAQSLRLQNRSEEAAALARDASEVFLQLGVRARYVSARITEAALLYDGGAVERALEVWSALEGDRDLDATSAVRVTHNIALCLCDLGRRVEAVAPLERCVSEFAILGLPTERTRSRWHLGNALLGTSRQRDAIVTLRLAWHEFAELGLSVDAALAALDLAEALVVQEEPAQIPMICHEVITQLTTAGLASQALPALRLLREAATLGRASRVLIRHAHATVKRVGREERLYAPGLEG
jgi:tetratricopeptide (TPR) repeat protein